MPQDPLYSQEELVLDLLRRKIQEAVVMPLLHPATLSKYVQELRSKIPNKAFDSSEHSIYHYPGHYIQNVSQNLLLGLLEKGFSDSYHR
jgi:hypothetical protein